MSRCTAYVDQAVGGGAHRGHLNPTKHATHATKEAPSIHEDSTKSTRRNWKCLTGPSGSHDTARFVDDARGSWIVAGFHPIGQEGHTQVQCRSCERYLSTCTIVPKSMRGDVAPRS